MADLKPNTAGVYAIYLKGTRFVYVGESADVRRRWYRHEIEWVWPNVAEYALVREMPGSTSAQRRRTEDALIRLLRRRYWVLSLPSNEASSRRAKKANATRTPEQRRTLTAAARAAVTPEGLIRRGRACAAWAARSPEQLAVRQAKAWATRYARYGAKGHA